MDQFRTPVESHAHSKQTLDLLYLYDSFMDNIEVVADMGCGHGLDVEWWASLTTRDDPPEPHNYLVYAVDRNIKNIEPDMLVRNPNIKTIQGDMSTDRIIPRQIDLMWCHDSFQYLLNPLEALRNWNAMMNIDGMLILSIPQHQTHQYNRIHTRSYSGCYYHYNVCNLMYMLAVNGFDCRDCYVLADSNNPWLQFAVYKSADPMDPTTTSWHDLADKNLINDSAKLSLNTYGYVRQEDLIFTWFDRDWHFAKN